MELGRTWTYFPWPNGEDFPNLCAGTPFQDANTCTNAKSYDNDLHGDALVNKKVQILCSILICEWDLK
jgi:hypothetical protein